MASLYPKKKSPYWFIEYRDPLSGKTRNESTKLRRDDAEATRKARQMCAQRTANELEVPSVRQGEQWEPWVSSFIVGHYPNEGSQLRARAAWFNLATYLRVKRIGSARSLLREHCSDYLLWRTNPAVRELGLRSARHNTARTELQILSAIMREAVMRKKATANPCLQLGIGRVKGKQKPEITLEQREIIETRLAAERGNYDYNEDMRIAWEIAIRYARRLTETAVRLDDVDLDEETITFRNKGGQEKTKLLHAELVPMFRKLKKEKREYAHRIWPNWSKIWKYFFKRCGLPNLSFHCVRVTVVNELRRKRVDPRLAREFVDHSSVIVHQSYERWRPDDQRAAVRALSRPVAFPADRERPGNERRRKQSK